MAPPIIMGNKTKEQQLADRIKREMDQQERMAAQLGGPGPSAGGPGRYTPPTYLATEVRPPTQEELSEMRAWIESMEVMNEDTLVIVRHRVKGKYGSIYRSAEEVARESRVTVTATVVRVGKNYQGSLVQGDYVLFSPYAPFASHPKYIQIQLLHARDALCRLTKMPPDVEDDLTTKPEEAAHERTTGTVPEGQQGTVGSDDGSGAGKVEGVQ